MPKTIPWFFLPALLAALAVACVGGCGKYDALERNMQYVSNDLLRKDAEVSWENLKAAHARWQSAKSGGDAEAARTAYNDAYGQYAVIYNELVDRQGGSITAYLRSPTEQLPPPPPGISVKAAPQTPTTQKPAEAPAARDLEEPATPDKAAKPTKPAKSVAPAVKPTSEAGPGADRYTVQNGDTLRAIAKRLHVTEQSLMAANGIADPDKLHAGKTLTIPAN